MKEQQKGVTGERRSRKDEAQDVHLELKFHTQQNLDGIKRRGVKRKRRKIPNPAFFRDPPRLSSCP